MGFEAWTTPRLSRSSEGKLSEEDSEAYVCSLSVGSCQHVKIERERACVCVVGVDRLEGVVVSHTVVEAAAALALDLALVGDGEEVSAVGAELDGHGNVMGKRRGLLGM